MPVQGVLSGPNPPSWSHLDLRPKRLIFEPFVGPLLGWFWDRFQGLNQAQNQTFWGSTYELILELFFEQFWGEFWGPIRGHLEVILCIHGVQKMLVLYLQFAAFRGPTRLNMGPEGASEGVWSWVLVFCVFFLAKCCPVLDQKQSPEDSKVGSKTRPKKVSL